MHLNCGQIGKPDWTNSEGLEPVGTTFLQVCVLAPWKKSPIANAVIFVPLKATELLMLLLLRIFHQVLFPKFMLYVDK